MASDAELIGWSLAGDQDAFVEMVSRHETAVGAYLTRRAGREAAADLLGEVWLSSFRSRATYDRAFPDARPWLFGVARNILRRHWRSRRPEEPVAEVEEMGAAWDPWPALDGHLDAEDALRAALAHLRPAEREVLTLVAWEGLTAAGAARALDIPAGTARRLLYQARLTLQRVPAIVSLVTQSSTLEETR